MKNKKFATLKDVAKAANTSVTSVSYILSGDENRYVSKELRKRVIKAAEKLNYVKSGLATGLKGQTRNMLAILVPQFDNIFFTRMATGVEEVTYKNGYMLNVCNTFDSTERERQIIENLVMHRIDGILISPTESSKDNIQYIKDFGIPFVIIDRTLNGIKNYDAVLTDNFNSGYLAAKELIDAGHKYIAFIGWATKVPNLKKRIAGCIKAFEERGLSKENISLFTYSDMRKSKGCQMIEQIVNEPNITGVIFGQHILAEKAFRYITENPSTVFEQMSVIIIGTPVWTSFCNPPVKCINQKEQKIGREASKRLIKKIEYQDKQDILPSTMKIIECEVK